MEYAYAALMLAESGEEINERNLKSVLSAAGSDIIESRVKAFVAALEDVDIDRLAEGESTPAGGADIDAETTSSDDGFAGMFQSRAPDAGSDATTSESAGDTMDRSDVPGQDSEQSSEDTTGFDGGT